MQDLKNKTVLVTGGTGSIGNELVKQILDQGVLRIVIFSRDETKHFIVKKRLADERLETVVGDIRDYGSIKRIFEQFDVDMIYHASAMKHVTMCEHFPLEGVKTNIIGTQNLMDLANRYNIPKLITISTDKSTNPVNVMGATKFIAERITMNAGFSCVRFGNVANSRGSVIPTFVDNLLNRKPLHISDLNVTRFIMMIPDAVDLVLKASEYAQGGEIFILKMNAFRLEDLLDVILNRIAPKLGISEDIPVNMMGLVRGEKVHEELISSVESFSTYELNGMYMVLQEDMGISNYVSAKKVFIDDYSSKNAEMLSKSDIETIIMDYLKNNLINGGFADG